MDLSVLLKHRSGAVAVAGVVAVAACGCGGAAASQSQGASQATSQTRSAWADKANAICRSALPDGSHELVDHLDAAHIEQHGMAIVAAGSRLDALGGPRQARAPGRTPA